MANKNNGKRLKYKSRPNLVTICRDLQDPVLADKFSFVYKKFRIDALMGSSAFRLLRLDWIEYFFVFSFDGMYYNYEIRVANTLFESSR